MTTIHFVRHAETVWHAENRYAGHSDIALTALGRSQAGALARWAAQQPLDLVVTSDLSRCVHTARPAAASHGMELVTERRLREVHFGDAEGLTRAEMAAAFPAALEAFLRCPASQPLPGAEPGEQAARRGIAALAAIHDRFPTGEVLVVGHATQFRLMLCWLLGLVLDDYRRVFPRLDNVAITTLRTPPDWSDAVRARLATGTGRVIPALETLNRPIR